MLFRQIVDDALAQYAYLIGCQRTGEALVVDPERDVDRYLAAAEAEGLRIVAVAETHIHADFVSGAREMAARGVTAYLSAEGGPDWQYRWPEPERARVRLLRHGDVFSVGHVEIRAVHTPGHTPEHLGFLVTDRGSGADAPIGFLSGDFLFVGDVGRPDLLESAAGFAGMMRPSAERLGESLRQFAGAADHLQIWPGHGAGSACGKAMGAMPMSTLGYERRFNPAFRLALERPEAFVDDILEGQPEPPLYFAAMKRINRDGPPVLGGVPPLPLLSAEDVRAAARRDDVVIVDTRRDRRAYMARHLRNSIHAPLDRTFPTTLGSLARIEEWVVLLVDADEADAAARQCIRIGFDRLAGQAPPEILDAMDPAELASIPVIDFAALQGNHRTIVDVRRGDEYRLGHLDGAVNIPHTRLLARIDEIPRGRPVAVHCASGVRAAVAASALARAGYDVAYVDDVFRQR